MLLEMYLRNCAWVRDKGLLVGPSQILCELYRDSASGANLLQLVSGSNFLTRLSSLLSSLSTSSLLGYVMSLCFVVDEISLCSSFLHNACKTCRYL